MNTIRIGTRGSRLALAQARLAEEAVRSADASVRTETVIMQTKGDANPDMPLREIGDKGLFVTEFEQALLEGRIDAAVHSAKDLPMRLADGLVIAAVLPRADVRDALITVKGKRLPGAGGKDAEAAPFVLGTGSLRRQTQAAAMWPEICCKQIRGNVETRLRKLYEGQYDGIVLARAGLDRLGIDSVSHPQLRFCLLEPSLHLPAACQGIIAVEAVEGSPTAEFFKKQTHAPTQLYFDLEREVLRLLEADCSEPAAAFAREEKGVLRLDVMYGGRKASGSCRPERKAGLALAALLAGQVRRGKGCL